MINSNKVVVMTNECSGSIKLWTIKDMQSCVDIEILRQNYWDSLDWSC